MEQDLIAPCGMNCSLCIAYQAREQDLNKQGFKRTYCPGCIPRGKHCLHMGHQCELLGKGLVRFCSECSDYPCKRLQSLDQRYREKYHMSMIDNLEFIKEYRMEEFLAKEETQWRCPTCGGRICCHNGLCLQCDVEKLRKKRTYRWDHLEGQEG